MALCLALPGTAQAACSPDPTPANSTVICSGVDADGLTINTNGTTVSVQQGATVSAMTGTTVADPTQFYPAGNAITINNNGQITGGLTVHSGTPAPGASFGPSTNVTLTVAASGSIGGATAIALIADPGALFPGFSVAGISIDNSGTIQSTSLAAITSNAPSAGVSTLTNQTSGQIGAIQAPVSFLTNSGTIDGGTNSAIAIGLGSGAQSNFAPGQWNNTGTIASNGSSATLDLQTGYSCGFAITNSGSIANAGSGNAISFVPLGTVQPLMNSAQGTIASAGGTAIVSTASLGIVNAGTISGLGTAIAVAASLNLSNSGTINGSVSAAGGIGSGSMIDLTGGGTINGNLTLGSGDDTVLVNYSAGISGVPGVSGSVDAGGGSDKLIYKLAGDTTIDSTITPPSTFESVGLRLATGSTVTLGSAFISASGIDVSLDAGSGGSATLINRGSISASGPALSNSGYYYGAINIQNSGSINATLVNGSDYAIQQPGQGSIINSGSIIASGGNGINAFGPVTNTGTIMASGTAVYDFDGPLTNDGTIVSTAGTALYLFGNQGLPANNTGTITGATIGAEVDGFTLTNSGTIGATNGLGVALDPYGSLVNQAGGVINGGVGTALYGFTFNSLVTNAGTIDGNVNFGSSSIGGNIFVALDGGVVNGNLSLGNGDRFVTSLTNTGPGAYAGVTGTVNGGGNDTLIFRVDADASAALVVADAVFSTVGYDLSNNAKLTLSATTPSSSGYSFSGAGTVNLTADLNGTGGQPLIDLLQPSQSASTANALAFTSNGTLTVTHGGSDAVPPNGIPAVVTLGGASSFTNAGTITLNDTAPQPHYYADMAAISSNGGGTIVNSGTISIGGATGIAGSLTIIANSGSILQLAGGADATGVSGSFTLTNSGTISTGGNAIVFAPSYASSASQVTNSGTISSANAAAISDGQPGYTYPSAVNAVINQSGGMISGGAGQAAIVLSGGGTIDNAGTINGDVTLGPVANQPFYYSSPGSIYIARGGTLNGNLTFGSGNDALIVVGNTIGITGQIDAGAGINSYAQLYTSSTTVDASAQSLPATFQAYAIGASGTGTTVTVTGPAGGIKTPLSFFGDGTVNNQANVNAAPSNQSGANRVELGQLDAALGVGNGLTFINQAVLADGVDGSVASFTNSGSIGSNNLQFSPVSLTAANGTTFNFTNNGQITGPNAESALFFLTPSVTIGEPGVFRTTTRLNASLSNSGTIAAGLTAGLTANHFDFTNSGTIGGVSTPFNGGGVAVSLTAYGVGSTANLAQQDSTAALSNTASGTFNGNASLYTTAASLSVGNAGAVNGTLSGTQTASSVFVTGPGGLGGAYVTIDQTSAIFDNSGTITSTGQLYSTAAADISAMATAVAGSNSGTIAAHSVQQTALQISDQTSGGNTVTVTNSGSLTASGASGSGLVVATTVLQADPATTAQASVTVTNTGTIAATGGGRYAQGYGSTPFYSYPAQIAVATGLAVAASAQGAASVTITNAAGASITAGGATSPGYPGATPIPAPYDQAGAVGVIASGDTVTLANSGTITGGPDIPTDANTVAYVAGVPLPLSGTVAGGVQIYAGTATLSNTATATINGSVALTATTSASLTNFGTINGNVTLSATDDSFVQGIGATVTGTADGGAGTDTLTIDLTGGGKLDAQLAHFVNFESTHLTGAGSITSTAPLAATTLVLDNAAITIGVGSTLQTSGPVTLTGGAGNNTIVNYGTIAGTVALGAGNDSFVEGIAASTGAVDGGGGTNTLTIDVSGGGNLTQALVPFTNFQTTALTGSGAVAVSAPVGAPTLVLNDAALTLTSGSTLQTGSGIALTGGAGANSFTNHGTVNGAVVGIDTVNAAGGTINIASSASTTAKFTNAAADAALNINTGTFALSQNLVNAGLVAVAHGATLTDLAGIANLAGGRITVASGGTINDVVDNAGTIVNNGNYNSNLNNLAGGSATNSAGAAWTGALSNAAGAKLANQGTVIGSVANAGSFTNASGASLSGALTQNAGTTSNYGALAGGAVIAGGSLTSSGTINGLSNAGTVTITGGTLTGTITNSGVLDFASGAIVSGSLANLAGGQLTGALGFGSGNDNLTLHSGAGVLGAIDGGAGTDTLIIASAGTDAGPDEYNLTRVTGFEQTTQTSGTIAVSGLYATTRLDILAGRYIGRTGSVLNADTINVAPGATFGSGGTVNGNVNVRGTLAPGGTVGAMSVNGNVALASGSTALFEVGQAASSQLLVSGTVAIASGATLSLAVVPDSPLKPGSSIDLIVASGGITGSFTTIDKPAGIFGFVVQRASKISLFGEFLADGSFSRPATSAVSYINSILAGGQASPSLLGALPSLLTSAGNTSAAAFVRLTPEAYASATQIGTDNGIAIASAIRHMEPMRAPDSGGLFVFAQGLGVWSRLDSSASTGTSRAQQNSGGMLGGIGFGSGSMSITGFAGYISGNQTIAALGARTSAEGAVVGASARLARGAFSGTATFAYDAGNADTTRSLPGGLLESAHYRLRSMTFDIEAGVDVPVGKSWQVRPQAGFTSVRTRRGAAVETGSGGAFDFTVARTSRTPSFIDGGLRIEAAPASTATFRPWLDLGIRHLLDTDSRFATAFLSGGPLGITVAGATRARTVATVGAGFNVSIERNVTLFAGYDGGFGTGTSGNKINGGLRASF